MKLRDFYVIAMTQYLEMEINSTKLEKFFLCSVLNNKYYDATFEPLSRKRYLYNVISRSLPFLACALLLSALSDNDLTWYLIQIDSSELRQMGMRVWVRREKELENVLLIYSTLELRSTLM